MVAAFQNDDFNDIDVDDIEDLNMDAIREMFLD